MPKSRAKGIEHTTRKMVVEIASIQLYTHEMKYIEGIGGVDS